MAIENANNPKTVKEVDPRVASGKESESVTYWENKAKEARARHDYLAEEEAMKMLGRTPEPAFQVKGSLDLGNMNPQAQAKEAQDRADKAIEGKDKDIKDANERAATAEAKLNEEKIEGLRRDFGSQMAELNKTIEKVGTAKDERPLHEQFKEQYTTLLNLAKDLGLEKTSTGRDPMVDLELAKMGYHEAQVEREFKWKMHQDEKNTDLEIQKAKDNREFRQKELAEQARRNDMLFSAPAAVGAAIAKGMAESAKGGAPSGGEIQGQPGSPQAFKGQATEGESGEIECPSCHAMVGVGPTTTSAECAWCHSKFDIKRVPATEVAEAEEEK